MAPSAGIEPATCGLEVRCSIRLSYKGITTNTLPSSVHEALTYLRHGVGYVENDLQLIPQLRRATTTDCASLVDC